MTLLVVAAGLATFLASLGVGLSALAALRVRLPAPWSAVVGLLLGLQLESALVQAVAMAAASSRPVLVALWAGFVAAGLAGLARARGELSLAPAGWRPSGMADAVPLAAGCVAVVANLLIAAAPSTKIDELYYHMLLPRRIVEDGGLRFYQFPWEGAAIPQMAYQIGAAPLHALRLPDAPNVTSWAIGAAIAWLGWYLLAERSATRALAAWWVPVAAVGLHAPVWYVTGGAHALGDLATVAALVAVADARTVRDRATPASFAFAVGVLTWAAASTKASLVPVSVALLAWGALAAISRAGRGERARVAAVALAPWIAFGAPLVAWTWSAAGSPYGPFFAWHFAGSVYDPALIRSMLGFTEAMNRSFGPGAWREPLVRASPLLWLAAAGAFVTGRWSRPTRLGIAAVALVHVGFVLGRVSWDVRFVHGLLLGLALLWALGEPAARWARGGRARLAVGMACVVPWLAAQLWYGAPLIAVAVGLEDREAFLRRFVAFHDDFRALDRVLPPDARLLSAIGRMPGVYAPRPIVFAPADVGAGERARTYVVTFACDARPDGGRGAVVYRNPRATAVTYRTPGRRPRVRDLCVRAPAAGDSAAP